MKTKPILLTDPWVVMATGNDWRGAVSKSRRRSESNYEARPSNLCEHWLGFPSLRSVFVPVYLDFLVFIPILPSLNIITVCVFFLIPPYTQSYAKTLCRPETPHSSGLNNSVNHRSIPLLPEPHSWPTQFDSHTDTGLINQVTLFPFTTEPSHINTELRDENQHRLFPNC